MAYDADLARPRLRSWTFQEYGAPGVLSREETYTVESNAPVEAIDDSLFRVVPAEGMIALDLGKLDFRIVGHDSVGFRTNYEANDYLARRAGIRFWTNVLILCAVLATGLGAIFYWVRRRKQR
jgi:predicted ABC-type sugar transport system permease subunit